MSSIETLAARDCVPCRGGVPPMEPAEIERYLEQLSGGWVAQRAQNPKGVQYDFLRKEFGFPDFRTALDFTNAVGELAQAQNHHPDIHLAWGRVTVEIWTHKINGLTESDFVFAAKTEQLRK